MVPTGYEAVNPGVPWPPPTRSPFTIVAQLSRLHGDPSHVTNKLTLLYLIKSKSVDRHRHYAYILFASRERKIHPMFEAWTVKRTSWYIIIK